jgi:hypothetical protein
MYERLTPGSLRRKLDGCTRFQYLMRKEIDRYNQHKPQNERIRAWTLSCKPRLGCGSAKLDNLACAALWDDLRVLAQVKGVHVAGDAWPTNAAALFEDCKHVRREHGNICGLHTSLATVSPLFINDSSTTVTAPQQATPTDHAGATQGATPTDRAGTTQGATPAEYANALQQAKLPSILFNTKEKKVLRRIGANAGKPDPKIEASIDNGTAVLAGIDMGNNKLITLTVNVWTPNSGSPGGGRYENKKFYLSRGDYYDKSGVYKLMRMTDSLDDELRDVLLELAEKPAGTVDVGVFHEHVATVGSHAKRMRQVYGSQKVKKYEFNVHCGKEQVVHEFMSRVEKAVREGERLRCQALCEPQGQAGIGQDDAKDQGKAHSKIGTLPQGGGARWRDDTLETLSALNSCDRGLALAFNMLLTRSRLFFSQSSCSPAASRRSQRPARAGSRRPSFGCANCSRTAFGSSGYRSIGPPSTTVPASNH